MEVKILVDKGAVMEEVAKTTSYAGAKMTEDEDAYKRIFTTDEDLAALDRFWNECCVDLCEMLKKNLESEGMTSDGRYAVQLELSNSFDRTLTGPIEKEALSYFVTGIVSKWYAYTNKSESGQYAAAAASLLEGIHRKVCYKRRPTRPTYN